MAHIGFDTNIILESARSGIVNEKDEDEILVPQGSKLVSFAINSLPAKPIDKNPVNSDRVLSRQTFLRQSTAVNLDNVYNTENQRTEFKRYMSGTISMIPENQADILPNCGLNMKKTKYKIAKFITGFVSIEDLEE